MMDPNGTSNERFHNSLLSVMDRKHHWYWNHLNGPTARREQLLIHFQQEWEVSVRDFAALLRNVHDRCPYPDVRADLAVKIAEEESKGADGTGARADLFLYMMEGLGFSREDFMNVSLLPGAAAYRRWIEESTLAWWLVGAAVTTIFVEGSVNDRRELSGDAPREPDEDLSRHPLVIHQGLDPRYLELKRVQRRVESAHRHNAYRMTVERALTASARRAMLAALEHSLDLWVVYRDQVAREAPLAATLQSAARRERPLPRTGL